MVELYPPIEPYDQGMLDVGEGNLGYWPDAELVVLADSGPQGSDTKRERILSALDTFARR